MYLKIRNKKINLLWSYFVRTILLLLPDTPLIMKFRGWLYSFGMFSCGHNLQVAASANIRGLLNVSAGNNVYIGPNAYILSRGRIKIGDDVLIAMNVVIVDTNHKFDGNSYRVLHSSPRPIDIGSGSWVAANSVLVPGTTIGKRTVIGAGVVCSTSYPDNSIYVCRNPRLLGSDDVEK
ncbi:acyltransferase [Paraglaciecola chathamensis]|nr:acyltransferase [Paraglaciecola chathamensis]